MFFGVVLIVIGVVIAAIMATKPRFGRRKTLSGSLQGATNKEQFQCAEAAPVTKERNASQVVSLRSDLLRKVGGDKRRLEWLLDAERKRRPEAADLEIVQAAVDRWEQDNRSWR